MTYKLTEWYPSLGIYSFPTTFVKLTPEELELLASGEENGKRTINIKKRIRKGMSHYIGNCFVFCDTCAPTDTERFNRKGGAVYSANSAWKYLCRSEKVKTAARKKEFEYICIRPFRRMNRMREVRLFIHDKSLVGISQYWLIKHFHRLDKLKKRYSELAKKFVDDITPLLPDKNITADIYFTSKDEIILIDFNQWGKPTSPLLFKTWEKDWLKTEETEFLTIQTPTEIAGEVNVSF